MRLAGRRLRALVDRRSLCKLRSLLRLRLCLLLICHAFIVAIKRINLMVERIHGVVQIIDSLSCRTIVISRRYEENKDSDGKAQSDKDEKFCHDWCSVRVNWVVLLR